MVAMALAYRHRNEERRPVNIPAILRLFRSGRSKTSISDISPLGCRINWQGRKLAEGDSVFIQIDQLAPIKATVIWQHWPIHGLQFAHPLHPAVAEHLINTWTDSLF
jgi:hypothetical protein